MPFSIRRWIRSYCTSDTTGPNVVPSAHALGALSDALSNKALAPAVLPLRRDRADRGALGLGIADHDLGGRGGRRGRRFLHARGWYQHARGGVARLARVHAHRLHVA